MKNPRGRHCASSSQLEVKPILVDIAEVARRSGVPASAIRFYEERGLVESVGRRGARRLFEPSILERLALISLGRAAGFSLDEIAAMFLPGRGLAVDRGQLKAKADEIDLRIRRLQAMRDGLRHAADCPAPRHADCPTFQRLVRLAGSGRLAPPQARPGRPGASVRPRPAKPPG